jgi:hypothetical protein
MARNGSGTMSIDYADFQSGANIVADELDANFSTIVTELTNSVAVDGQSTMTGDLAMGTNKITGVGDPTSAQDVVTKAYFEANASAGGPWGYVSGQTISSPVSTVEFTSFEDNYDYLIVFDDLHWTGNGVNFYMQLGTGVTPTWLTANYTWFCHAVYGQTGTVYTGVAGNGATSAQVQLFYNNGIADASRPCMGSVEIRRPKDNEHTAALVSGMCAYSNVNGLSTERGAFVHRADAIVTAAKIYRASGNIDDGKFRLYRRSVA